MPDDSAFIWPACGTTQVIPVSSGGCSVRIAFAERGIVTAIGRGRIIRIRTIPTKRIARQYEITIQHERDFESSYSITDLTPQAVEGDPCWPKSLTQQVNQGDKLYDIANGGYLYFQLSRAGKLIDPREFLPANPDGPTDPADRSHIA